MNGMPTRLLIVEDHLDTLDMLAELLRRAGYVVVGASNGTVARVAAASQRFDLAICDVGLPDCDGCDLFAELRALYGLRGIAVSGYGMPGDVDRCNAAGFAAFVLKPYINGDLFETIERVLSDHGVAFESEHASSPSDARGA